MAFLIKILVANRVTIRVAVGEAIGLPELCLIGISEMLHLGVTHGQQVLHDFLFRLAVEIADHVQNFAGTDETVGGAGMGSVECMAGFDLEAEEIVLEEHDEARLNLSAGERGVLDELQDG